MHHSSSLESLALYEYNKFYHVKSKRSVYVHPSRKQYTEGTLLEWNVVFHHHHHHHHPHERSYWETLPIHLLEMILLHLLDGQNDIDRFRLTCISWQSITLPLYMMPIPRIIQSSDQLLPLLQSSSSPQIPWLMFFAQQRSYGILKFLHPITSETYVIEIPQLAGAVFRYCKNDWLLMSRGKHSFFFFNPFTMSTTKLLDVHKVFKIFNVCFTAPPTSPSYQVFAHGWFLNSIELHFYIDNEWVTEFIEEDEETTPTPVLCKGNIYSLGYHGMLGVYSPDKEPDWEVIRETKLPNISYNSQYLAECDGELVSVFVGSSVKPVRVYRFDWSMSRWQELDSLGSKTMFVSESGSVLIETKGKGIENRIYFPRFRSKEGSEIPGRRRKDHIQRSRGCVFYSLQTRKYHCLRSNFSSKDWTGTGGVHDHCTWISVPTDY